MNTSDIMTWYDFMIEHLSHLTWNDPYTLTTIIVSIVLLVILAVVDEILQTDTKTFRVNKVACVILTSFVVDLTWLVIFEFNIFAAVVGIPISFLSSTVLYFWLYTLFEKRILPKTANRKSKKIQTYVDCIYENKDEIIDQYNEHPEVVQSLPIVTILNLYGYTTLNQNERCKMENNHTIDNVEAFLDTMKNLPCITPREEEEIIIIFNTIRTNGRLIKRDEIDSILAQYHEKKAAEEEYNDTHDIKDKDTDK